ncbi:MAG: L-2-hydroxyglutarate oxidase [Bacteroidota bacterium]
MKYDIVVVGGGIVGLATAYKLLLKKSKLNLLLLEKEGKLAAHQTGHNSGVIHSGIYYKPGSLKAKNCIDGYHEMIKFCKEEGIDYELCGKVIVATDSSEVTALNNIYDRGVENGLKGLKKISADEIKEREPYVNGKEGIFVPQTGIINYKQVAERLGEKIKDLGGELIFNQEVIQINTSKSYSEILTNNATYTASQVVTCGGLYSDRLARQTEPDLSVKIVPFRGEYFKLKENRKYLVRNLIYPVPDPNFPFLGVHFTRMIDGAVEAGPNAVLAFKREGYSKSQIGISELTETLAWPGFQKVAAKYWKTGFGEMYRSFSKAAFTKALQKLIPDIREEDLEPGGAGVRAQACDREGGLLDDFMIVENNNAVHVCNAPSPAATSSLSIGETVANIAIKPFN